MTKRQQYADSKDENMKKNPNYRVSLTSKRSDNMRIIRIESEKFAKEGL